MAIEKLSEPYQCSKKLSWGDSDVSHYAMITAVIILGLDRAIFEKA